MTPGSEPAGASSRSEIRTPKSSSPLLEVRDLTVELPVAGRFRSAVDRVSFTLSDGESVGLVGESGSGKTQLVRALMGLSPDGARVSGEVRLGGRDLSGRSDREWSEIRGAQIGVVFQEPAAALDPVRTIGEHLAEAIRLHRPATDAETRRISLDVLRAVGFAGAEDGLDAYPHRLSGGLRQRACIAIALAPGPRVLLADEPTASVDATIALQILDLLDRLRRERGLAILLVTHDLGLLARHGDRALVMYAGRVVEEADVDALFREPAHPYTRALLQAAPRLGAVERAAHGRYATIPGTQPDLAARLDRGCAFAPRCPERFEPCDASEPALLPRAGGGVRCFLFDPERRLR